ncbi:unnamed protein product [Bursaphelenchus xylophilus]|uniref:(pine wood nematode) hypothetical protein n=1 Tax=Bursaphelenchus xylophilus TaxID=6326 RepID=A0A1I7RLZ7_BURXY|nr:unnamed protein product [Bursaphelenchus xylophilus]CAG9113393.1 unnamed protein product [Bursaphelenchus xylophilus]
MSRPVTRDCHGSGSERLRHRTGGFLGSAPAPEPKVGARLPSCQKDYPTENWDGKKKFVIESRGPLGPAALFQTVAYMTIGVMLFLLALFMFVVEFGGSTFVKGREFLSSVQQRMAVQNLDGI